MYLYLCFVLVTLNGRHALLRNRVEIVIVQVLCQTKACHQGHVCLMQRFRRLFHASSVA